jgi:hypothetical protein
LKTTFPATINRGVICPHPAYAGRVAVDFARFKPGEPLTVTVESEARRRTLRQNSRYWALIVPAFADWTGYESYPEHLEKRDLAALKDSAHRTLKAMILGPRTVTRTLPNGHTIEEIQEPSTKDLTTAQFAELQNKAEKLLNENGIYLPADERIL